MQFFVLNQEPITERQTARVDSLKAEGTKYGEAPHCDKCGQYVGMRSWLPPYRVELETWGLEFADVVSLGTDLLVSLRFKEAWKQSHLVGLSGFEAVEIVRIKRHRKAIGRPPPYFRAIVSQSHTAIDLATSGFEWVNAPTCSMCLLGDVIKRWKLTIIDQETWTGEDIFIARGLPGEIIVSSAFKGFCESNRFKGTTFVPAESFSHDFYPSGQTAILCSGIASSGGAPIKIMGVHPVVAPQPCHLIELEIGEQSAPFDWGAVTQDDPAQPRANWQVAYDEAPLNDEGTRWAFFMHYLDFSRPLLTPAGSLELPAPTPLPDRLKHVKYDEP